MQHRAVGSILFPIHPAYVCPTSCLRFRRAGIQGSVPLPRPSPPCLVREAHSYDVGVDVHRCLLQERSLFLLHSLLATLGKQFPFDLPPVSLA